MTPELQAEIKKNAGAFFVGIWDPDNTDDWRGMAFRCEEELLEETSLPAESQEDPADEFYAALHSAVWLLRFR